LHQHAGCLKKVADTFIRKSAKGSKCLVGRAPRKRRTSAKPGLSSNDYAPVLIVRDCHGATLDYVLPDLEAPTFARVMRPVVAGDALLVSDGRAAYAQFADDTGASERTAAITSRTSMPTSAA
jgi:hypothetical protein